MEKKFPSEWFTAYFRCGEISFQHLRTAESYSGWVSEWVFLLPVTILIKHMGWMERYKER